MTSFLRLNGIAVPVAVGNSPSLAQEDIGGKVRRAIDGTAVVPRRAIKRSWKFGTVIKAAAEALAWRDLVSGRGHVLSFDSQNSYTSKGMAPVSVAAGWGFSTSSPKYGAACASWSTGNAVWAFFTSTSAWTVAYWLNVGGGGWHHVVVTSDGGAWLDGIGGGAPPVGWSTSTDGFGGVSSGNATFGSTSASKIDDIVALPYVVPSTWPAQIYGFGFAFGLLPVIKADGLFIEQNSIVQVVGSEPSGKAQLGRLGSGLVKNLHDFSFELLER